MRNILTSRLGGAATTAILAALALVGVSATANAYDGYYWRGHWYHSWPHYEWYGARHYGWYRPYYYAPPAYYPPAYGYNYYGPSVTFGYRAY